MPNHDVLVYGCMDGNIIQTLSLQDGKSSIIEFSHTESVYKVLKHAQDKFLLTFDGYGDPTLSFNADGALVSVVEAPTFRRRPSVPKRASANGHYFLNSKIYNSDGSLFRITSDISLTDNSLNTQVPNSDYVVINGEIYFIGRLRDEFGNFIWNYRNEFGLFKLGATGNDWIPVTLPGFDLFSTEFVLLPAHGVPGVAAYLFGYFTTGETGNNFWEISDTGVITGYRVEAFFDINIYDVAYPVKDGVVYSLDSSIHGSVIQNGFTFNVFDFVNRTVISKTIPAGLITLPPGTSSLRVRQRYEDGIFIAMICEISVFDGENYTSQIFNKYAVYDLVNEVVIGSGDFNQPNSELYESISQFTRLDIDGVTLLSLPAYDIAGVCKMGDNTGVQTELICMDETGKRIIGRTKSDPGTGAYSFRCWTPGKKTVLAKHPVTGGWRIAAELVPTLVV